MAEEKKKKELKSLIRFIVPIKLTTTAEGGKIREKKIQRIYLTSQNISIINVFLESLLSGSFPSLGVAVHFTSLGYPPTLC